MYYTAHHHDYHIFLQPAGSSNGGVAAVVRLLILLCDRIQKVSAKVLFMAISLNPNVFLVIHSRIVYA